MADETKTTEEPEAPVPAAVQAEADASVNADVNADADAGAAEEPAPAAAEPAPVTAEEPAPAPVTAEEPAPAAVEAEPAPVAKAHPAPAPITETTTPTERREARAAARLAESGARTNRTPEARQDERDAARRAKATARRLRRGQERESYKASEHERVPTPAREHVAGQKKTRQGIVVSDKAAKTITVRIDVARPHRKYKKIVRTSMTLHAHDERDAAHIGDTVVVQESRPLSATKRWRLVEVVERAR